MKIDKPSFFGASFGTLIEYYDLSIFTLFLPIFAPTIFHSSTDYQALVKGYIILFAAFIARPLGGLFFGFLGDKFSRKKALLLTIYGIAIATFLIGLIPSAQQVGILAAIILFLCKLGQFFCFGGEYSGAGIYVAEHGDKNSAGFWSSLLTATTLVGALLASLIAIILTLPNMPAYSWRFAFIIGGILGFLSALYRKKMHEPPGFKPANLQKINFSFLLKHFPLQLITFTFLGGMITIPFTTVLAFINPVLLTQHVFSKQSLMWHQAIVSFYCMVLLVLTGFVSRKIKLEILIVSALAGLVVLSYPLLTLTHNVKSSIFILLAEMGILFFNEMILGPLNAFGKTLFPTHCRYRGVAFSFSLGIALFGSITPLLESYLYSLTHNLASCAYWISSVALISLGLVYSILKRGLNCH